MAFLEPTAPKFRVRRQASIRKTLTGITDETMVANIIAIYEQATAEEYHAGLGWYAVAHEIALDLGIGAEAGAGVIAALSPQLSWTSNIAAARNLVTNDDPNPAGIGNFVGRAREIRDGADPFDALGGRKVRSFYRNILMPSRPGAVTVDRHAVNIATNVDGRILEKPGCYQMVAGAYRTAARLADILPHECQAVCWVVWRRMLNEQGIRGHHFRV